MKLRCKEGDTALVIKGDNAGKVVKVVKFLGSLQPGDKVAIPCGDVMYYITIMSWSGNFWWCEGIGMPLVSLTGQSDSRGAFADHHLLPLRGEPDPEWMPRSVEKPNETAS